MAEPSRRALLAGFLSMLLPGAGQILRGARRRGILLLAATALLLLVLLAAVAWRGREGLPVLDRRLVAVLLALDLALLAFRVFAVVDAARGTRTATARVVLLALVGATVLPHAAAGYVTVRSYDVLETVFAKEEPRDVLPSEGLFVEALVVPPPRYPGIAAPPSAPRPAPVAEPRYDEPLDASNRVLAREEPLQGKPWTTILLLGTDEGPGNSGARTDTMILAAIQHATGRAVAFGIPRNLVAVPLGGGLAGKPKRFDQPLNALYGFARTQPALFPGGRDPGATALKQAVSTLLGVRVDYYALVNLRGFADLVDGLGGVRILVKERLVDEVTRPALGEPKPRIDVVPGRRYHFYGREALAYVRSRKDSNDYTRMARQRCFLSAMADQLDPVRLLRNFPGLARTVEANVATDVPLRRLPALVRLVAGVDPRETLTETFGATYIASRRKLDNYPLPKLGLTRQAVRDAILDPDRASAERGLVSAGKSC
ncbi:MAG: LCP family protein [Actinobacteria bacterium]|nr:LCP family protein [Actinomycetota bacterium]